MSDLRHRQFQRILLIKPSAVGDVVHALPVLVKLRARYPQARIDWLITPENAGLVAHHPALSSTIDFPRRQYSRFGRSWAATVGPVRLLASIRERRYDLVIDLHGQFRSALFTLASAAPVRIGFDRPGRAARATRKAGLLGQHGWTGAREGSWIAYTHRIAIPTLDVHAIDRYLWLGPMLGLDSDPPDLRIHLAPEASESIDEKLWTLGLGGAGKPLGVLVPGTIWETKHWHVPGFAAVGRHLLAAGFDVIIAGTARDLPRSRAMALASPGLRDLCGRTSVAELVALIRRAAVCVTNDSGSMHIAVAVGSPVVSVFGPTNPTWIGPYRRPSAVVSAGVSCGGCYLRSLRHCPHGHRCMQEVAPAMVIERIEQVLTEASSATTGG
jgi:lipopolysaccharide heptosyltransferase II